MASNTVTSPPKLVRQGDDHSDNESVSSNEMDNSQDFTRLESDIKEQMTTIATQVKESISDIMDHMQLRFNDFDRHFQRVEARLTEQAKQIAGSQSRVSSLTESNANSNNLQNSSTNAAQNSSSLGSQPDLHISAGTGEINPSSINSTMASRGDNYVKLKPQNYSGVDDFEDFLAQFEITAEINAWDYRAKSLYLANSLTGDARSLLNELTNEQRRDYKSLVEKLTSRFGSENRAEVFRAQLKSRVKAKGESIAQLAHSVKKLTRQSYPNASANVVEALALDHFIDALSESEIRLRLREVGPKTLSEAEAIAVRMEAHRIADRQRTRLVGKTEQQSSDSPSSQKDLYNQLSTISKSLESLQKHIQNLSYQGMQAKYTQQRNMNGNPSGISNRTNFGRQNNSRNYYSRGNMQSKGGNPNYSQQTNQNNPSLRNTPQQGNSHQSNQGSGFRLR